MADKVGMVVRKGSQIAVSSSENISRFLEHKGVITYTIDGVEDLQDETLFIISNGGDGTVLKSARIVVESEKNIPIFPVNSGTVGFLTEIDCREAIPELEKILEGQYKEEVHHTLDVYLDGKYMGFAVNDIVITSEHGRILDGKLFLDNVLISSIRGDRMIISPPLGSTAYNLSAGGSIIHPKLEAMSITCVAHFYTTRFFPLIVPISTEVKFVISHTPTDNYVVLDGQMVEVNGKKINGGQSITVKVSDKTFKLIYTERSYYERINKVILTQQEKSAWLEPVPGDIY
ncbi:MAG: NAD(+)/NADH kinase [Candidatus Jordarchaeum sp.]|uniref:NAD(+)/NADH kinase n=1 Tax=Candidatus Jordarchaeum sp. TaxID=2823881 RepID=UPI0040497253